MRHKEPWVVILVLALLIPAVAGLWGRSVILILVILVIALMKHLLSPIKKEAALFVVAGIIGAGSECLVMFGGPWSYARPSLINFPVWLPFLWGLAGTTGITLYQWMSR